MFCNWLQKSKGMFGLHLLSGADLGGNELRWELFRAKKSWCRKPPTSHNYIMILDTTHSESKCCSPNQQNVQKVPEHKVPSLQGNRWEISPEGTVLATECLELPALKAVMELVKCLRRKEFRSYISSSRTAFCRVQPYANVVTVSEKNYDVQSTEDT